MKTETEKQSALGGACIAPPAQTEDELPPFQGLPASLCKKLQTGICTGQFQKITCSMPTNKRVRHLTAKPFWKNGVMAVQWERQEGRRQGVSQKHDARGSV